MGLGGGVAEEGEDLEELELGIDKALGMPVLGEWSALPTVWLAGSRAEGDGVFDALFHPHAPRLLARCDAVLRIGGGSAGADLMVSTARTLGKKVFYKMDEIWRCPPNPATR